MGLPPLPEPEAGMAMITLSRTVMPLAGTLAASQAEMAATQAGAQALGQQQVAPSASAPGGQSPDQGKPEGSSAKPQVAPPASESAKPKSGQSPGTAKSALDAVGELAAYRRWAGKGRTGRPFECHSLTRADALSLAPELLNDSRIVLKDGGSGPKAPASRPRGLAGTGTRS